MLKNILEEIKKFGCNKLIMTKDLTGRIDEEVSKYMNNYFEVEILNDLRSATFYTNGRATKANKPIILLTEGRYLPNIYTGITEAWFQRLNIIIISLFENYDEIKVNYLNRCVPDIVTFYDTFQDKYKKIVEKMAFTQYPSLINIKYNLIKNTKIDYSIIYHKVEKIMNKEEIILYNAVEIPEGRNKIIYINDEYKYGSLSKYMGYIIGKNKKTLLCATSDILTLDLNIFNNRYIDGKVKIIIIDKNETIGKNHIDKWIEQNNIEVDTYREVQKEELQKFWDSEKPKIIILKGGI